MTARLSLLLLAVMLLLAGCINPIVGIIGSNDTTTSEFDLDGFSEVSAASAFRVTITQGESFAVSVTANQNVMDDVRVDVRGVKLVLELTRTNYTNLDLSAEITMPELTAVEVSGASTVQFSGFGATDRFDAQASGASKVEGTLTANEAMLEASGASTITLDGSADALNARASGASNLVLGELAAATAVVEVSGASRADVNVSESLSVTASGASSVRYAGAAEIDDLNVSGASTVDKT